MKASKADLAKLTTMQIVKLRIKLFLSNLIISAIVIGCVLVVGVVGAIVISGTAEAGESQKYEYTDKLVYEAWERVDNRKDWTREQKKLVIDNLILCASNKIQQKYINVNEWKLRVKVCSYEWKNRTSSRP